MAGLLRWRRLVYEGEENIVQEDTVLSRSYGRRPCAFTLTVLVITCLAMHRSFPLAVSFLDMLIKNYLRVMWPRIVSRSDETEITGRALLP
jgi:hypothetical protein